MVKFSMPIFYIFVHNRSVLDNLPNFYLLRTLELMFFGPFFRLFTAAINFPCCCANCYHNLNPCGIFSQKYHTILNQDLEQGKLMAAVNSRK